MARRAVLKCSSTTRGDSSCPLDPFKSMALLSRVIPEYPSRKTDKRKTIKLSIRGVSIMYESIFNKQKQFFQTKETMPLDIRIKALKQLKDAIRFYEDDLMFAMRSDFNKNESDAFLTEIGIVYSEINFHLKHLSEWAESVNVKTPVTHFGSKSTIYKEPYGVTLIISPWNYPFNLAIAPLVGALSA